VHHHLTASVATRVHLWRGIKALSRASYADSASLLARSARTPASGALHHFDADRALAEIRRVLRPGGVLALFWAWPADDQTGPYPALREVDQAVESARGATQIAAAYRSWTKPPTQVHGFTPFERREFPTTHVVPSARLADLYATSSDIASLASDVRADLLARIRGITRSLPEVLEIPARSVVDLCFRPR
jgi:SAM-dependent methyltransferase